MRLYGIKNCDTVRKARTWLDAHGVAYEFHDFKLAGLDAATLDRWLRAVGWESLLNRRGTTWRRLPEALRDAIDAERARTLMLEQTSVIKRPVLERDGHIHVGFSADAYRDLFGA